MTPNRRIALNVIATYGRSLYALVIGLFCGRWTLMALGEVDYGLYGLIAGLTVFISFFNSLMATAVGRFFAYSIGHAEKKGAEGLELSRRWFNVALVLHTTFPVLFLSLGYPAGVWAINRFLAIPVGRVYDCILVWRFVCASCFLMMVTVPFNAIYTAKQYIAELTVYSFATATIHFVFVYYMVSHPGVWLVKLALCACVLAITPQIIISIRAFWLFDECRIVPSYMKDFAKMKEISTYAFYRFFGALGIMLRRQGIDILVNKFLGPQSNAAITVAGTVSGHTNSLSSSFLTALSPAIANTYGAGDLGRMRRLTYATCKFSAMFVAIFALPLILEADNVFHIWLSSPPEGSVEICVGLLVILILENLSSGFYMAIFSEGNIKMYQIFCLCAAIVALPLIGLLLFCGMGVVSVVYGLLTAQVLIVGIRLFFGRRICGLSIKKWVFGIASPIATVSVLSLVAGVLPKMVFESSFGRIVATVICTLTVFLPLGWMIVLDKYERDLAVERIFRPIFAKFQR